jgi:predicted lysophospholipase L1 biosynthesis ABC-type transport system permease subunit
MMSLTWRWFWRSTQRREYLWLWLAVILSSASVTLISQVSQSVRATMVAETVNSMGAQLLLRSTQPIDRHWAEQAAKAEIMVGELWLDVRALIDQIQQLMQQASTAIRFLYGFALLASILVVMSATLAAREARYRQWLVLRTLGAQQRQLILIGLAEYALIGLLAGTLAALLAQLSLALISVYWLALPIHWDIALWLWSLGLGSGSLVLIAVLSQAKLWSMRARALMHHNE